eukprot:4496248-Amphidinium_carterae.1
MPASRAAAKADPTSQDEAQVKTQLTSRVSSPRQKMMGSHGSSVKGILPQPGKDAFSCRVCT